MVGTLEPAGIQLTYNPGGDYSPNWSDDGRQLVYTYSVEGNTPVQAGSDCIAMIPETGGTRSFTMCDTRSTQADSASVFLSVALRPGGQLLFMQVIGQPKATPLPRSFGLWIADTIAPLSTRKLLRSFPTPIGDSVVNGLVNSLWIDSTTFVAIAVRMVYPCKDVQCVSRDTLPVPLYLVRGTVSAGDVSLAEIYGSDNAAYFARTSDGDLLFSKAKVPGDGGFPHLVGEGLLRRIPLAGGISEVVATTPGNAVIRGLTCHQRTCLVLTSAMMYTMLTDGWQFGTAFPGEVISFATWDTPTLSPDGTELAYRDGKNLFRREVRLP